MSAQTCYIKSTLVCIHIFMLSKFYMVLCFLFLAKFMPITITTFKNWRTTHTNVFTFSEASLNTQWTVVQTHVPNCGRQTICFFCMGIISPLLSKCMSLHVRVCRIVSAVESACGFKLSPSDTTPPNYLMQTHMPLNILHLVPMYAHQNVKENKIQRIKQAGEW